MEIKQTLRGPVNDCANGKTCPKIVETSIGLAVVGVSVDDPVLLGRLGAGPGEAAVVIPASLLPEVS